VIAPGVYTEKHEARQSPQGPRPIFSSTGAAPPRCPGLGRRWPAGAICEIAALCALQDCLPSPDFNRFDPHFGVSAGGFIAAGLAHGLSPHQMRDIFIEDQQREDNFDPAWMLKPAWSEFGTRWARLPGLLTSALWAWGAQGISPNSALERLGAALPKGLLDNEGVHHHIERLFARKGRSNGFQQLRSRLTLVATELDTGEAAPFGRPDWDHRPISRAIRASAALPGRFPPVKINRKHDVDGALKKTGDANRQTRQMLRERLSTLAPLPPRRQRPAAAALDRLNATLDDLQQRLPTLSQQAHA
jgi:NTE family protein